MQTPTSHILTAGLVTTIAMTSQLTSAQEVAPRRLKIVLVGDSTVNKGGGWGPGFAKLLKPNAECINLAQNGRSSKSYRDEGHWVKAIAEKPDYLFLQFGHNDQPGKGPQRETDPKTTYAANMGRYVDEARGIGARPILVTSLTRRRFGDDGKIKSDLVEYVEAVKKVAAEKHVPLIDLNARSIELMNEIGPKAADEFDHPVEAGKNPDKTHLSDKGSDAFGLVVSNEVKRVMPELAPYFIENPKVTYAAGSKHLQPDIIVAPDGSGHYKTVQEAVDAVPADNTKPVLIYIRSGVYKTHLVVPKDKPFLTFVGEDAEKTLLTNDLHVKSLGADGKEVGTVGSASVVINAPDFTAENVTFENNAPHVAQALAIYVNADRAKFTGCRFLGWQDTIRVRSGRQYFGQCYINGRTDFIYGEATSFFDRCHIHVLEQGWITAANTPEDHPYGLVFSNCTITGEPGVKTCLGRPWRPYAQTVFLNTQMEDVIAPEGWNDWGKPNPEQTVRYAEYKSHRPDGTPVDVSQRLAWTKQLTDEEAAKYTLKNVLGDWEVGG